ncbi:MAG: tRNA (N6-threonylcarbamoyladenosine(37)-N6)-methyltransferase TrmO [Candidatus Binatia bacterium]
MLSLTPIGVVRNEVKTPVLHGWGAVVSHLVLDGAYTGALDGLEEYSHVVVVFWMDRAEAPKSLKRHVQRREELPIVGIFASRGPHRPNPIGISAVPIISHERNALKVKGLDAIDGTPILDIKPYTPAFDRVDNPQVPDWCRLLYDIEDYF